MLAHGQQFVGGDRQGELDPALAPGGVEAGDDQVGVQGQRIARGQDGPRALGQAVTALPVVAPLGDAVGIGEGEEAAGGGDPRPGLPCQPLEQAVQLGGGSVHGRQAPGVRVLLIQPVHR